MKMQRSLQSTQHVSQTPAICHALGQVVLTRLFALVGVLSVSLPVGVMAAEPPAGFKALFNGKDLSGWVGLGHFDPRTLAAMSAEQKAETFAKNAEDLKTHWTVENGELVNDGHGVYATTDKNYGDIELLIKYKTVPKADSGIYLRGNPQVQIWDAGNPEILNLGADKGSGGLWNNSPGAPGKDPLVLADAPFGEWNSFRIIQVGARTTVYLNDKLVVDHAIMENFWDRTTPLFKDGPIQLQTHGGEIRWKDIFIREIPADEANAILLKNGAAGFKPLFDGKSLDGWAGAVDQYDVVNGAIRCQQGKGGNLFTKESFSDFVARLEFKLPPAGNNGFAIRYPGKGDPAYDAMTELQVLDTEAPVYATIDPRQAHGSAYGMVAAKRGYLRPVGQWNFEEVTVVGSRVKVELNGTVILDADLSTVTEYLDNKPHPGKDRTEGHLAFAGHSDPVEFRLVHVKPLK
jgi:Domain of Unknown Function (DUF1080)